MKNQINSFVLLMFMAFFAFNLEGQNSSLPKTFIEQSDSGLLYDAEFEVGKKSISGVVVMKNVGDKYHVVLLSKFGYTILDFEITDKDIVWNKRIPGKRNSALHHAIEDDFRLILLTALKSPRKIKAKKNNTYKVKANNNIKVQLSKDDEKIISARSVGLINPFKSYVTYTFEQDDQIPQNICLSHNLIKVAIIMNRLKKNNFFLKIEPVHVAICWDDL